MNADSFVFQETWGKGWEEDKADTGTRPDMLLKKWQSLPPALSGIEPCAHGAGLRNEVTVTCSAPPTAQSEETVNRLRSQGLEDVCLSVLVNQHLEVLYGRHTLADVCLCIGLA